MNTLEQGREGAEEMSGVAVGARGLVWNHSWPGGTGGQHEQTDTQMTTQKAGKA